MKGLISLLVLFCLVTSNKLAALQSTKTTKTHNDILYYDLGLTGGWIPYQKGANAGSIGVFEEVINHISDISGIPFKAVHFPPKRAEKALISGLVDFDFICLEWFTNGIDNSKFVVTEPIFQISEMFIVKKAAQHRLTSPHSYFGKDIGTIAGYFYLNDDKFNRLDFLNEQQVMLGLKNDRFEIAILEREVARHWAKVHDVEIEFPLVHTSGLIRLRLRIENLVHLKKINDAIITIRKNGKLRETLNKHGLTSYISSVTDE
ncbi:transporter substrate-binding domain-containing protein [Psychrosphaera sp.]|nr:transporter substrate-binding domain-containing protein [Psychrosphaera sp.]